MLRAIEQIVYNGLEKQLSKFEYEWVINIILLLFVCFIVLVMILDEKYHKKRARICNK